MLIPAHVISLDQEELIHLSQLKSKNSECYDQWRLSEKEYQSALRESAARHGHERTGIFNTFSDADILDGHLIIGW